MRKRACTLVSRMIGHSPKKVVSEVNKIGRMRRAPASRTACRGLSPSSRRSWLAASTSTRLAFTETPLQLAAAVGSVRLVELLLSNGASPFFSSMESNDDVGFSSTASQSSGCYPAISVAAIHGHKKILK